MKGLFGSSHLVLLMGSLVNSVAIAEIEKGSVCYLEDLAVSLEQLIKSEGYILVDLYAQWCGPCKSLNPILSTIAKENPHILVLKIDIEQFDEIRTEYGVKSIPTILLFKNGAQVAQEVGFLTQNNIQNLINRYLRT